jgi:hypothetical protein
LTTRRFEIFPFGVRASEVEIFIRRAWLQLRFGLSEAHLKLFPLRSEVYLAAYGGAITATLRPEIFGEAVSGEIVASGLRLAEHAQLNALGVTAGTLSGIVSPLITDPHGIAEAAFSLTLADGAKPEPFKVSPGVFGIPFGFAIPPVTELSIRVRGAVAPPHIALNEIAIGSSLGTFSGSAKVPREAQGTLSVDGLLTLTEEGVKELGPYLTIASGGTLVVDRSKIRLFVRGPLKAPRVRITRAG